MYATNKTQSKTITVGLAAALIAAISLSALQQHAAGQTSAPDAQSDDAARASDLQLQHEISQLLWGCYAVGADLVGAGDVEGAKAVLRKCFAPNMTFQAVMPPAYSALGFSTGNGADGFVDFAHQFYTSLHFTRTQHSLTNLTVERVGPHSIIARSSGLATHVFPDEHVLNATIRFEDRLERMRGEWKFVQRTMFVSSLTQVTAWTP